MVECDRCGTTEGVERSCGCTDARQYLCERCERDAGPCVYCES